MLRRVAAADRALGRSVRAAIRTRAPGATDALGLAGRLLSPAFRGVVVLLLLDPRRRREGSAALLATVTAATIARHTRTRIDRRRPGDRVEGGFPSRHAAAAVALVSAVGGARTPLGRTAAAAATVGLLGRVVRADHDPADIAAGAVVGMCVGGGMRRFLLLLERVASRR